MSEFYGGTKPIFNVDAVYGDSSTRSGHFGVTYRGVNYVRCPFDYVIYQMLIDVVRPDLIIEIGTFNGGGALYLADLLEKTGKGMVHTIDLEEREYDEKVMTHPLIKCYFGGYELYDLGMTKEYDKILVIDDGSHKYEDVKRAFEKFSRLVPEGSYYIIEDGIASGDPALDGGPSRFIREMQDDRFVIDRGCCDFFGKNATFNPDGYLRAVK